MAVYLDTSAAVKLVQQEDGSDALRGWLAAHPEQVLASSTILHTELLRATRRGRPDLLGSAREVLDAVVLIEVGWEVRERAGLLDPDGMRGLDALHLASALALAEDLDGVLTYDARLRAAAEGLGLPVVAP